MRLAIFALTLLFVGSVAAQDAAKTFTLTVTSQDLNALSAGLDELPRKVSQPIVEKFQKQLIPQMQPVEVKPEEKK